MAAPEGAMVEIGPALDEPLAVASPRVGGDPDAGPGEVCSPAELDVVTVERDRRIEAAERSEEVGAAISRNSGRRLIWQPWTIAIFWLPRSIRHK
jgi:hypothetical protein